MRRSPRPLARTSPDLGWTSPGWGPRASSGAGGLAVGWAGSVGWGRVGDGGRGHLGSPGCAGAVGRGSWGPAGVRDVPLVGSRLRRAGVWLLPGLSPSPCCAAGCRGVPTCGGAGTRHVVTALLCLGTGQSPGGLGRVLLTVLSISHFPSLRVALAGACSSLWLGPGQGHVPVGGCGGQERLEHPGAPSPTPLPPREFDPSRMEIAAPPRLPLPLHPATAAACPPGWPCLLPPVMDPPSPQQLPWVSGVPDGRPKPWAVPWVAQSPFVGAKGLEP